ncbi:cytochrome P450 [Podospora aff. communis PSN243]|uniref:Cytochrome P450 n=1 Tax=Podospora aff. communis PSN243 TaxID=3040156 RepID=A0AAV9G0B2_9PEZI|nr:cytochrome P450 [Podospora aff. communis PSN243]
MASHIFLAAAACICLAFGWVIWRLFPSAPLPGYPHNASSRRRLFGDGKHIKQMAEMTRESSLALFDLNRRLGEPVVQMLITRGPPMIAIDDPREVEDIVLRRNKEFDHSWYTMQLFDRAFPHATIAQPTTPSLKAQKRLWVDAMNADFLRRTVAPNLQNAARELVELWTIRAEQAAGEPFDVSGHFHDTALDAIWTALLGSKLGVLRSEIEKLRGVKSTLDPEALRTIETVRFVITSGNDMVATALNSIWPTFSLWFATLTPTYRRFKRASTEEVQKVMRRAYARFQALADSNDATSDKDQGSEHDTCAMDLVMRREILTARKAGRPSSDPTRDSYMLDELWMLLLAGHDSTAHTLGWFVKFMALYPASQSRLRQVLSAALDTKLPSANAIIGEDIPFLDAVMEETLRCAATSPVINRDVLVDTEILGRKVPAGSVLFLNLRIDHDPFPVDEAIRSPTSRAAQLKRTRGGFEGESGRDITKFEPRRWLTKDAEGREVFDAYSLPTLGFGGGYRGCFGKRLAMMELRIIVVTLILNFEFLSLPEELAGLEGEESVFRQPQKIFVRLKQL